MDICTSTKIGVKDLNGFKVLKGLKWNKYKSTDTEKTAMDRLNNILYRE